LKLTIQSALAQIDRGAWVRFFGALAGLTLAFGAAIFSTTYRMAGNLWMTAILASLALLLAGAVGLLTVPYLARRVVVTRVRDAFDYDLTTEGLVYLGIILVIVIAALNTGNNLLFIVVSAMLAAIVVSGTASALMLRALELEATLPDYVFAQRGVLARFRLDNRRRVAPAFSVSLVPLKPAKQKEAWHWERTTFAFPPDRPPGRQWVRWPDLALRRSAPAAATAPIVSEPVYFAHVPAQSAASAEVELNFARRGRYQQEALGIATRFPFSFLIKTRRVPLRREIIVFPSVEPTDELLEILPMLTGEFEVFVAGRGHDLYRIREHMPGDSARHVDWKASAKSQSLKVREFSREDERRLRIAFDNPAPGVLSDAGYERGVALAASLAWHFAQENTQLSFAAPDLAAGSDLYRFLRHLALAEPAPARIAAMPIEQLTAGDDEFNVVLTARARGSIATSLWAGAYFVFLQD
jgi:uncharacterized protein (DUF58 family)